jgi:predicted amidohydrolase YtcJ
MSHTTVYEARKIITMNPMQPEATHVAVRDGCILAVGSLERMREWGAFDLDTRFADQVLMPGLVEGHSHLMAGGLWQFPFVGFHERTAPDGKVWAGCRNFDEVVSRLRELEAQIDDPAKPLLAWGFDPIFFGGERMTVHHLDRVSATRPVVIMHASLHLMNVNSAALAKVDITRETEVEGVVRFDDGEPTGELQEFAAMFPISRLTGNIFRVAGTTEQSLRLFGNIAQFAGVTTATDLVNDLSDENAQVLKRVTAEADFPVRLVPAYIGLEGSVSPEAGAARVRSCLAASTDKLHFGLVKIITDGSIQGFTARVRWPGYFNGHDNGIWIQSPAELKATIAHFHAAGFQLHIHTNGDEATGLALDGIEAALAAFAARGIARVALQEHVPGPVLKFYALADGSFFRYYDAERGLNGALPSVDERPLAQLVFAAARLLGLDVFGGDVVLTEPDRPVLIDLNDWPSFAPFREDAAVHIAEYLRHHADDRRPQ